MAENNEDVLAQISAVMKPNGQIDQQAAKQAATSLVNGLNGMSADEAKAAGIKLYNALDNTRRGIDTDNDRKIEPHEILTAAQKDSSALLKVLPKEIRGMTADAVQVGMNTHGDVITAECANVDALQKKFDQAEEATNDAISGIKLADNLSWMNGAGTLVNAAIEKSYGKTTPQLNDLGMKNLNTIITQARAGLPKEVELPSAQETCDVIAPKVPMMMASTTETKIR